MSGLEYTGRFDYKLVIAVPADSAVHTGNFARPSALTVLTENHNYSSICSQ